MQLESWLENKTLGVALYLKLMLSDSSLNQDACSHRFLPILWGQMLYVLEFCRLSSSGFQELMIVIDDV